jgi:PAS domain-containing protein
MKPPKRRQNTSARVEPCLRVNDDGHLCAPFFGARDILVSKGAPGFRRSIWCKDLVNRRASANSILYLNELMYIPNIFRTDPLAGAAIFLYLATIWWCIWVIRRRQRGTDRLLLGLLGLIAFSQSLGVFKHLDILESSVPFHRLDDFVNLAIGGLYLIGALLLEISSRDRISAAVGLRLAQASPGNAPRLYTQASNAVLVLASDGFIVQCNPAAENVLGRKRSAIIGTKPIFERTKLPSTVEPSKAKTPHEVKLEAQIDSAVAGGPRTSVRL